MMPSNVAFFTLALRPMTPASAFARSASMPSTVFPSEPMNSFGGYDASAATVSVPLLLTAAGSFAATAGTACVDAAGVGAGVDALDSELEPSLEPHAAAA